MGFVVLLKMIINFFEDPRRMMSIDKITYDFSFY